MSLTWSVIHIRVCGRPVREWIRSLDEMRALVPEYMVPSHTAPVIGTEAVQKQLTDYRDAIAWIFAETIRVRGRHQIP